METTEIAIKSIENLRNKIKDTEAWKFAITESEKYTQMNRTDLENGAFEMSCQIVDIIHETGKILDCLKLINLLEND